MALEFLVSFFVLLGAFFALVGSIGLVRLPDFFARLHRATKSTTLGVGGVLIASMLYFSFQGEGPSLHEVLITVFLFMTAPVSAYLLASSGLHLRVSSTARPPQNTKSGARGG